MRIAIIAPPFIPVPPLTYGGTELFVGHLAEALTARGHHVIVYANGQSRVRCELRWLYRDMRWPPSKPGDGVLRGLDHSAWAIHDSESAGVDIVHVNDAGAVPLTRFLSVPAVHTLHHPHEPDLSELYNAHPDVLYIAISDRQRGYEGMRRLRTIHHGIRTSDYRVSDRKEEYLSFLGRFAPMKGAHHAIEVAHRTGIPLKLAGEIQPAFRDYWEQEIAPHVDGRTVEYIGEATPEVKNELLAHARALLFPIGWEEPFGLVMLEAMACGTPVLAFAGGAVEEIVRDGVSGWICRDIEELAMRAARPEIEPASCREYVSRCFSLELMAERYERAYEEALTVRSSEEEAGAERNGTYTERR